VAPADALAAADHAVIIRELARATAFRLGHRAIFAPMLDPDGTGNGVHIHMSLCDEEDQSVTYEAGQPYNLSAPAAHFFAGVLEHLPALCAVTAPSPVSYLRLRPNRWAPIQADLAVQDRATSLRVCPVFGAADNESLRDQFNVEYRPADATASPYLALGAIIFAGVDGLKRKLELPPDASSASRVTARAPRQLPRSLGTALDALKETAAASAWFGPTHIDAYLRAKRAEAANTKDFDAAALCARYAAAY
jgi:glutamine synthetase